MHLRVASEAGPTSKIELPSQIKNDLKLLAEGLDLYFENNARSMEIATDKLTLSRLRLDGVVEANRRMQLASEGSYARRKPIEVRRVNEDEWIVIDGNSTAANAILSGWSSLRCVEIEGNQ
jgi:hypothetical protein